MKTLIPISPDSTFEGRNGTAQINKIEIWEAGTGNITLTGVSRATGKPIRGGFFMKEADLDQLAEAIKNRPKKNPTLPLSPAEETKV